MPKASTLRKGHIINIDNHPYQVKQIDVHTPSARGANTLYKVRYVSLVTGEKRDQSYKGNDLLEEMTVDRRRVSFLYQDQHFFTFMDSENYEQYTLSENTLEDQRQWLVEGMEDILLLVREGSPLCIELPQSVDLEIVETTPVIKGATATNRNKPATLSNGITVLVPEYMTAGEIIRVNTETGQYMSRVKG
ncbi:elongation factor P-like protein YeiP [Desulfosarcina sp. OttesenSCG-928-A07]|nr:elongation factor P-like protein YeiP [Desulfosarcina sp. OttesenSCG-928-G17]MDL2328927.1 elongation factor P-like protein YeiP [Desulfosarcina sp. OttesenSCG-928-A07]